MEQPLWLVGAAVAGLFAFVGMIAMLRDQRSHRRQGRVVLILPSVGETRAAIASFQAAVRRDELVDFVWRKFGPAAFAARACNPRRRG